MHLAEGVLPAAQAAVWFAPAAVAVGVGIRTLRTQTQEGRQRKIMIGMVGALVFAISLMPIPVPVAGSVSHPCGTPLAAVLLGPWVSTLVAAISLLFQALFFAHGGLSTWGANIVSEGIAGSFVGVGVFLLSRRMGFSLFICGFLAGFLGDLAVYAATALELSLGLFGVQQIGREWLTLFGSFLPVQGPLALGEALLTGGVLTYVAKVRPDILMQLRVIKHPPESRAPVTPEGASA